MFSKYPFIPLLLWCISYHRIDAQPYLSTPFFAVDSLTYSPSSSLQMDLLPRSASDNTSLLLIAKDEGEFTLSILDLGDRVWIKKKFSHRKGSYAIPLSTYSLPEGWYWVKVEPLGAVPSFFMSLAIER